MSVNYRFTSLAKASLALLTVATISAQATEGGGSVYPNGTENYLMGALPPPGVYTMLYGQAYRATRVNDNNGNNLNVPGFKVSANVIAPRLAWVPGVNVLGGDVVVHAIVPLVNLTVNVAGASQSKSGLGDITTGVGLGYHHSPNLHSVVAVDFYLPTGGYSKTDLANIGRNYFAFEPVYALSYIDPTGFNADFKMGYIVNSRNKATDYTSGGEFHSDFSLGWAVGKGWTAGAGGYVYQQMTDDKAAGNTVANNKGRAFAIGPSVKYDSGKGWFVTAKWQAETAVRNRAQGNALWIKAVFPM